jgi:hypothetical protein
MVLVATKVGIPGEGLPQTGTSAVEVSFLLVVRRWVGLGGLRITQG